MTIRPMESGEKPIVKNLFNTVYDATFSSPIPDFDTVTEGEKLYVAEIDGAVVGMASVWKPDCFIHFLFVDPAARHQKIGSELVECLSQEYGSPLTLKCLMINTAAMAFYRTTGWEQIGAGESEDGAYALMQYGGG